MTKNVLKQTMKNIFYITRVLARGGKNALVEKSGDSSFFNGDVAKDPGGFLARGVHWREVL